MAEGGYDTTPKPGEKFGYLRSQYEPKRKEAEEKLKQSGIKTGQRFKKARRNFARKLLETEVQGNTDSVTGLLNRNGFNQRFEEEISRMKREGVKRMFIRIDLNFFKEVNDIKGHHEGDLILKKVGDILKEESRLIDILSRAGGDEFDILLSTDSLYGTYDWWNRVGVRLKNAGISVGAGVTELNPNNPQDSIKIADKALYKAKSLSKLNNTNELVAL